MTELGAAVTGYPAGHVEGYPDTFRGLFAAVYADVAAGRPSAEPAYPTFADGHDVMLVCDAVVESARSRLGASQEERTMKLGLLTAAFPDTLTEVADWAAANGFSAEVACWPRGDGARRYAGVSHIDVAGLSDGEAKELVEDLAGRSIEISGLGFYPNPLHPDPAVREDALAHLRVLIAGPPGWACRWSTPSSGPTPPGRCARTSRPPGGSCPTWSPTPATTGSSWPSRTAP